MEKWLSSVESGKSERWQQVAHQWEKVATVTYGPVLELSTDNDGPHSLGQQADALQNPPHHSVDPVAPGQEEREESISSNPATYYNGARWYTKHGGATDTSSDTSD